MCCTNKFIKLGLTGNPLLGHASAKYIRRDYEKRQFNLSRINVYRNVVILDFSFRL